MWRGGVVGGTTGRVELSTVVGDVNADGVVTGDDLELSCRALPTGDLRFDVNQDGQLNAADVRTLVEDVLPIGVGDSNLDGVFNSRDLGAIFVAGHYEKPVSGTATWATGDWNCDGSFTSSELVLAFTLGSYSASSRPTNSALNPSAVDRVFG